MASTRQGELRSFDYDSLADMYKDWEDALEEPEESKEHWVIDYDYNGTVKCFRYLSCFPHEEMKAIGNYFESEDEAARAVEKLKAFKRLKDKGFRFEGIKEDYTRITQAQNPFRTGKRYLQFNKSEDEYWMKENWKDLDTCFGGEE